jgi:hypothetical protein
MTPPKQTTEAINQNLKTLGIAYNIPEMMARKPIN